MDFLNPELNVRFGNSVILATGMTVPEAAVHEYGRMIFRKNDIGLARKRLDIHAIPETLLKQGFPQLDFGLRVDGTNPRHNIVSLLYGNLVGHIMKKALVPLYLL